MAKGAGNAKGGFGSGSKKMGGGGMKPSRPSAIKAPMKAPMKAPPSMPPSPMPPAPSPMGPPPAPAAGPPGAAFASGGSVKSARVPIAHPPSTPANKVGAIKPPKGPGMTGVSLPSAGGAFAKGGPVRRPWMGGGK